MDNGTVAINESIIDYSIEMMTNVSKLIIFYLKNQELYDMLVNEYEGEAKKEFELYAKDVLNHIGIVKEHYTSLSGIINEMVELMISSDADLAQTYGERMISMFEGEYHG